MRVLLTGGAGYIGSHAARELARQGHEVRIFDNLSTGHRGFTTGFELIAGDVRDTSALLPALAGVDAVMHFAANINVGESVENPRKYFENNSVGALNLLNAVVAAGVRYFVFSSTAAVYGMPDAVPITESAPRKPLNPYGAAKLFVEHVLEAYDQAYGLRFASLRYFNAAGAHPSGEIGELHDPETHLIPNALFAAMGVRPYLPVFGRDYATPDGTCLRDYIHVCDLAAGHVAALEHLAAGGESVELNLGTGRGYSVLEIISGIERITGKRVPTKFEPRRPGDPPELLADAALAEKTLAWKAERSLDEIIASAWRWTQSSHAQDEATAGRIGTGSFRGQSPKQTRTSRGALPAPQGGAGRVKPQPTKR